MADWSLRNSVASIRSSSVGSPRDLPPHRPSLAGSHGIQDFVDRTTLVVAQRADTAFRVQQLTVERRTKIVLGPLRQPSRRDEQIPRLHRRRHIVDLALQARRRFRRPDAGCRAAGNSAWTRYCSRTWSSAQPALSRAGRTYSRHVSALSPVNAAYGAFGLVVAADNRNGQRAELRLLVNRPRTGDADCPAPTLGAGRVGSARPRDHAPSGQVGRTAVPTGQRHPSVESPRHLGHPRPVPQARARSKWSAPPRTAEPKVSSSRGTSVLTLSAVAGPCPSSTATLIPQVVTLVGPKCCNKALRSPVLCARPGQPQGLVHGQAAPPGGVAKVPRSVAAAPCHLDRKIGITQVTGDGRADQTRLGQSCQRHPAGVGVAGHRMNVQLGQHRAQLPTS